MTDAITERLAAFIVGTRTAEIPADVALQTKRAILDTVGVMLAGTVEDCARIAADLVRSEGGRPAATVVGQGFAAPARAAALVNGTAAHALDYDDVNSSMRGHPSPPLVPAVLAAGEETNATGADLIAAYAVGSEVQCRLGRALGPSHYPHGWHATSTLGTLGAAAAAARLYGLTEQQTRMALGIAVSLAGGSRQNFGTMTKPLHPGNAAAGGLLAARLAARGFTADADIIEAPLGFLNLFSTDDAHPERALDGLGRPFDIVATGISVKKYPCCFGTHRALDAVLGLRADDGVAAEAVEAVRVTVPAGAAAATIHHRPQTGLEGKFSIEYCVAAALLDGRIVLDTFEDAAVRRPEAQALLRRVAIEELPRTPEHPGDYADVCISVRGGAELTRRVGEPRGGPSTPLSWDELVAKYRDCAARALDPGAVDRSLALIGDLERLPATRDLMETLAGRPVAAAV